MTDNSALPGVLQKIMPWLEAAVAETHGTHTVADVLGQLAQGRLHLWAGERCFGLTEFVDHPQKRAFNIFLAGGDRTEFEEIQHGMEAFARAGGATMFMHYGRITEGVRKRSGWERIGRGFKPAWIAMTKDIEP